MSSTRTTILLNGKIYELHAIGAGCVTIRQGRISPDQSFFPSVSSDEFADLVRIMSQGQGVR